MTDQLIHHRLRGRLDHLGLTPRLTAWYVGLLAVLLVGLGAFLYVGLERLSTATLVDLATRENQAVVRELTRALRADQPFSSLAQAVLDVHRSPPGQSLIAIADAQGRVVAHTSGPPELVGVLRAAGIDAVRAGATEWLAVLDGGPDGTLVVSVAMLADPASGTPLGFVQITVPLTNIEVGTRLLVLMLCLGFSIVLLLAAVIGPRLTRLGLRPLREMARASGRLAEGDLTTRVIAPETGDEVGDLARAFNDMAERLEAAFAAQRAFVADASHELRTPLHALGGQLDVLVRVIDNRPDEARRLAGFMRRELDRLTVLVEDLLVLARLETQGAEALHFDVLDLAAVSRDVFEQSRALSVGHGRTLRMEVQPGRVPVRGDPHRLHQVLLNLVTNGLQHAPDHGCVSMSVNGRDGQAWVQVRDDGPGIPPEHLGKVFERFYRTDAARARLGGGAGLGLAIARAIVEAHRGSIAASNAPEGGALFTVVLPLAA